MDTGAAAVGSPSVDPMAMPSAQTVPDQGLDVAQVLAKRLYTAEATSSGDGRDGRAVTSDGGLDLEVRRPREMGGPGGGPNPEQLFALGYAACFHGAMKHVARERKLDTSGSTVTASVAIGPKAGGPGFGLAVELAIALPALPRDQARELVQAAHQVCPYSNATRGNIAVTLDLGQTAA